MLAILWLKTATRGSLRLLSLRTISPFKLAGLNLFINAFLIMNVFRHVQNLRKQSIPFQESYMNVA